MPILDLVLVEREDAPADDDLVQRVADAVGDALDLKPGRAWVRKRTLWLKDYAENKVSQAELDLPAFVTILHSRAPTGDTLVSEVTTLTASIAKAIGRRSDLVHIEYAPSAINRLAFGGHLVGPA
jgi:hypothetical protein